MLPTVNHQPQASAFNNLYLANLLYHKWKSTYFLPSLLPKPGLCQKGTPVGVDPSLDSRPQAGTPAWLVTFPDKDGDGQPWDANAGV